MTTIDTKTINEFIESKGGSVSIPELVNFLSGTDSVTTDVPPKTTLPNPDSNGTEYMRIEYAPPTNPELFDKFLKITRKDDNEELSKEIFDKRCAENGLRFEFLEKDIVLSTGARMTGKLTSIRDGKYIYLRDYWVVHNVPPKYSKAKTTVKKSKV